MNDNEMMQQIMGALNNINHRLDNFEKSVNERFENIEKRFDQIDEQLEELTEHAEITRTATNVNGEILEKLTNYLTATGRVEPEALERNIQMS